MRCPYCNTTFPPPLAGQTAQLRCARCGGRLFAWLDDPFGARDFPEPQRSTGKRQSSGGGAATNNGWVITLVVVAILAYFLYFASPLLLSLLIH